MRASHLLFGVAGLTSLTVAAPALSGAASFDTKSATNGGPDPVDLSTTSTLAGLGDTVVCQNTLDNGNCEVIHAQDRCAILGPELSHKVQTIYQAPGSICKYFKSDCSTDHLIISVNSRNKPATVQLEKDVGENIGLVRCQKDWPTAELSSGSASIEARDASQPPPSIPVLVCTRTAICIDLYPYNQCRRLPPSHDHLAEIVFQEMGHVCKYYDLDCSEKWPVVIVDSREKHIHWNATGLTRGFSSVICRAQPWNTAELEDGSVPIITHESVSASSINEEDGFDLQTSKDTPLEASRDDDSHTVMAAPLHSFDTDSINVIAQTTKDTKSARSAAGEQPLYVCRHQNFEGRCTFYEAPRCANNPFGGDAIQSVAIHAGFRCAFYHEPNCEAYKSPPHYEEARVGDKRMPTLPYSIISMACNTIPFIPPKEALPIKRDGNSAVGDTEICKAPNFTACTRNLNALNRCLNFDPTAGGVRSLKQFQGVICTWYRGFGCARESKDSELMVIDSVAGTVKIPDLKENNDQFKSVECRGEAF